MQQLVCHSSFGEAQKARILELDIGKPGRQILVNRDPNAMFVLEANIKVLMSIIGLFSGNGVMCV